MFKKTLLVLVLLFAIGFGANQYFSLYSPLTLTSEQINYLKELSKSHPSAPEFYLKIKPSGIGAELAEKYAERPQDKNLYIRPGVKGSGHIRVNNNTDSEADFSVDAVDQYKNEKGETFYQLSSSPKTGISQYFTFPEKKVTIRPNSFRLVKFEYNIPKDYAEGESTFGLTSTTFSKNQSGPVITNLRVVLGTKAIVSNDQKIPKQYSWPTLQLSTIYLFASILLLQLYLVYSRSQKRND